MQDSLLATGPRRSGGLQRNIHFANGVSHDARPGIVLVCK